MFRQQIWATIRLSIVFVVFSLIVSAQVTTYQSEDQYLSALSGFGYTILTEGFEDDTAWQSARAPATAAAVLSQGVVWTSNHPDAVTLPSAITTGSGAARTGSYGVYSLPHGDPDVTDITGFKRDGFIATRATGGTAFYGVGGWYTGNPPGSRIRLFFDGNEANSVEVGPVDGNFRFFGVIVPTGFHKVEVRETEGHTGDEKLIFGDDFTFAVKSSETGVVTTVSSANYAGSPLALGSIGSAFGVGLASATAATTSTDLPSSLAGAEVRIRDGAGANHVAPLYFVSPGQISYLLPQAMALGTAAVSVVSNSQEVGTGWVRLAQVAPGLYTANADGRGAVAAWAQRKSPGPAETFSLTFQCGQEVGSCVTAPVDLGADADETILWLYGTGIQNRSALSAVSVTFDGIAGEVLSAGPEGSFPGLDQVNVKVPRALVGRGEVDIELVVDGVAANKTTVRFR